MGHGAFDIELGQHIECCDLSHAQHTQLSVYLCTFLDQNVAGASLSNSSLSGYGEVE